MRVPLHLIRAEGRIRATDAARVDALAASIAEVGLLNPITVYERTVIRSGQSVPGYGLVAGAHRLDACRKLGQEEIEVSVVALGEHERVIAECDENLCGANLTPSEVAEFTGARKRAYEAKHGSPKAIGAAAAHAAMGHAADAPAKLAVAFTSDTAAATGRSERTVRRDAERGLEIIPQALHAVRGTELDTGTFLDALKKIAPEKQLRYVEQKLAEGREKRARPKPLPEARDPDDVTEAQVRKLLAAWNAAGEEARDEFLLRIGRAA